MKKLNRSLWLAELEASPGLPTLILLAALGRSRQRQWGNHLLRLLNHQRRLAATRAAERNAWMASLRARMRQRRWTRQMRRCACSSVAPVTPSGFTMRASRRNSMNGCKRFCQFIGNGLLICLRKLRRRYRHCLRRFRCLRVRAGKRVLRFCLLQVLSLVLWLVLQAVEARFCRRS